MGRATNTHGKKRNTCIILMGRPEGKRPVELPRRRWEDSVKMNLRKIGWGGMDLMYLSQDRGQWRALVNTVMILRGSVKLWEILK
jgi:hypothetical protein